jgi:hypothetical protein
VTFSYPKNGTELNITDGFAIDTITPVTINGTVVVPYHASTGTWNVSVTTLDGGTAWKSSAFTVSKHPAPTIGSMIPAMASRNSTITFVLSGTGFQPGQTRVILSHPGYGELDTFLYSVSSTQIVGGVQVLPDAPPGAWTVNVTTVDGGKVSKTAAFTIRNVTKPFITTFTPSTGYRDTTIAFILYGSGFQPGGRSSVTFFNTTSKTVLETRLKVVYPTQISGQVNIPADAGTGTWDVNVTTTDGGSYVKAKVLKIR